MADDSWEFTRAREMHVSEAGIIGCRSTASRPREQKWYNHMSAIDIRDKLGKRDWQRYFKFCAIRNPYDKLVSLFFFHRKQGLIDNAQNEDPIKSFRKWLGERVPVTDRGQYMIGNEICVDYCIRYEQLEKGIEFVCRKIGVPFEPERIPSLKSGIRDHTIPIDSFYTEELIHSVAIAYRFELDQFGYSFPATGASYCRPRESLRIEGGAE